MSMRIVIVEYNKNMDETLNLGKLSSRKETAKQEYLQICCGIKLTNSRMWVNIKNIY